MNRWRRKRRTISSVNPTANLEFHEKKVAKSDRSEDVLPANEEEMRQLAKNDPHYRE